MTLERWTAVDHYLETLFGTPDRHFMDALHASDQAGLPAIQVAPAQGQLLAILAQTVNARAILEIGTLGGYSTLWLAHGLSSDGQIITLEADPKHAEVARSNFARAGLQSRINVRVGKALDSLPQLAAEIAGNELPLFDLVFIDADKPNTLNYYEWALKITRPGALIIADNVIRDGAVVDATSTDASVQGARQFNAALAADSRVTATILQLVGTKGYDGMAIARVKGNAP